MKVILLGVDGGLGKEIRPYFPQALAPSHEELDITDSRKVKSTFSFFGPELIIHAAGLADVRACEIDRELAWKANVKGTQNVVDAARSCANKPLLLYPSSPCVFSGCNGNYVESSRKAPENYYGQTKAEAEEIILEYENSLVFRKNFVSRGPWKYPKAFTDRFGTYLYADEVANVMFQLSKSNLRGIVHIAGKERLSMFELARITTPNVLPMKLKDIDLKLTADMTMRSERIQAFSIFKSNRRPESYSEFGLELLSQS